MVVSQCLVVGPSQFLYVAKNSRYYFEITLIVLKNALAFVDSSGATVSVNLSIKDIEYAPIREQILSFLNSQQAGKIILEITESESIQDPKMVNNFIQAAKSLGAEIAIDDFGSGFSNFDNIVNLDIDYVKLDGSLVSKIHDEKYRIILENMVNICHDLGIKTIAEYISDESIMRLAKGIGVDYLQGHHLHKPEHWNSVRETFGFEGGKSA